MRFDNTRGKETEHKTLEKSYFGNFFYFID